MKKTMLVNVDKDAWLGIRRMFPSSSDSKRSKIVSSIVSRSGINVNLLPERSDSKGDRLLKGLMKDLL